MFRGIVVCSDGSDHAKQAARAAAEIAKRFQSHLTLLSVFNVSALMSPFANALEAAPELESVLKIGEETHTHVLQQTGKVLEEAGVEFQTCCESGNPVETILRATENKKADLVVLGSRGLSQWKALLLGSVSDTVLHRAPCPVLIVRGETPTFERILLASDGSAGAYCATMTAGMLACKFEVPLTILNVVPPLDFSSRVFQDEADRDEKTLQLRSALAARIRRVAEQTGVNYSIRQDQGHPAETIVRFAQENGDSVIVMGNRGMTAMQALALGSVSDRVAHHAHCSVLVVR